MASEELKKPAEPDENRKRRRGSTFVQAPLYLKNDEEEYNVPHDDDAPVLDDDGKQDEEFFEAPDMADGVSCQSAYYLPL